MRTAVWLYRIFGGEDMLGRRWTVWSSRSLVRVVYSSSSSRRMEKQEGRREEKVQPVKDCGRSWRSMGSPGLI